MAHVYQPVPVNAVLDIVGSHVANVNNSKRQYKIILQFIFIVLDKGCNSGEVFTCLNGGKCLSTGFCECKAGYIGTICVECV